MIDHAELIEAYKVDLRECIADGEARPEWVGEHLAKWKAELASLEGAETIVLDRYGVPTSDSKAVAKVELDTLRLIQAVVNAR